MIPRRRLLALAVMASWTVGCGGSNLEYRPDPDLAGQAIERQVLERRVHELVNEERRARGLSALEWNDAIRPAARGHSAHMARRNYFSHYAPNGDDFSDRYRRAGFSCRVPAGRRRVLTGGENLFLGHVVQQWTVYSDGRREVARRNDLESLARATVDGWLGSRPHRRNMLNAHWRTQAIGARITDDGQVYVTQNFC